MYRTIRAEEQERQTASSMNDENPTNIGGEPRLHWPTSRNSRKHQFAAGGCSVSVPRGYARFLAVARLAHHFPRSIELAVVEQAGASVLFLGLSFSLAEASQVEE